MDKLYAGKFDSHLLKNIQAAKHFILVLTPHSLDRLLNDNNCEDWIHKEVSSLKTVPNDYNFTLFSYDVHLNTIKM